MKVKLFSNTMVNVRGSVEERGVVPFLGRFEAWVENEEVTITFFGPDLTLYKLLDRGTSADLYALYMAFQDLKEHIDEFLLEHALTQEKLGKTDE